MAWLQLTDGIKQVLSDMAKSSAASRAGTIEGVQIKTLNQRVDARGFFIEQLKRGDVDDAVSYTHLTLPTILRV